MANLEKLKRLIDRTDAKFYLQRQVEMYDNEYHYKKHYMPISDIYQALNYIYEQRGHEFLMTTECEGINDNHFINDCFSVIAEIDSQFYCGFEHEIISMLGIENCIEIGKKIVSDERICFSIDYVILGAVTFNEGTGTNEGLFAAIASNPLESHFLQRIKKDYWGIIVSFSETRLKDMPTSRQIAYEIAYIKWANGKITKIMKESKSEINCIMNRLNN